jgi:hypothetical protein
MKTPVYSRSSQFQNLSLVYYVTSHENDPWCRELAHRLARRGSCDEDELGMNDSPLRTADVFIVAWCFNPLEPLLRRHNDTEKLTSNTLA